MTLTTSGMSHNQNTVARGGPLLKVRVDKPKVERRFLDSYDIVQQNPPCLEAAVAARAEYEPPAGSVNLLKFDEKSFQHVLNRLAPGNHTQDVRQVVSDAVRDNVEDGLHPVATLCFPAALKKTPTGAVMTFVGECDASAGKQTLRGSFIANVAFSNGQFYAETLPTIAWRWQR